MPLLIAFVVVPLVELYILIEVGGLIGALPTIGLCLLTAALGAALLKQQGLQTLARARHNMDRGDVPAIELFEGVALAIGGVLLLTPGLATDVIGFACLLPFSRRWLVGVALRRMRFYYGPPGGHSAGPPDGSARRGHGRVEIIEAEQERRRRDE